MPSSKGAAKVQFRTTGEARGAAADVMIGVANGDISTEEAEQLVQILKQHDRELKKQLSELQKSQKAKRTSNTK